MVGSNVDGKRSRMHIPISGASLAVLSSRREPIWHIVLSNDMSMLASIYADVFWNKCNATCGNAMVDDRLLIHYDRYRR